MRRALAAALLLPPSLLVPLALGGCGALPIILTKVVPALGGAMTIAKDGLDLDVSWHQLRDLTAPPPAPAAPAKPGATK